MSKKKKYNFKTWFKFQLNKRANWFNFRKKLFQLWWTNAPKSQINLEKGNYYIRLGAIAQVGQPINIHTVKGETRHRYIGNLYFNFKENKIT